MKTVGIICEYNPLHTGHVKQFQMIRDCLGNDTVIVCLMSGNFVQRGVPAIIDKTLRAKAAVCCGADLVLELPVTYALSSAEGFAAGGVRILGSFCDYLCFGAESANKDVLMSIASALLSDAFPSALRSHLDAGLSFPAARQAALDDMGLDGTLLTSPNNILAVEYCKAILSSGCAMEPLPIHRGGSYHDETADLENPSATSVRKLMMGAQDFQKFIPNDAVHIFRGAPLHSIDAGERAILGRLRTMRDAEFEALPYGSEGLWRKFMRESRQKATVEEILSATKSKRYTRTRLDRMLMCAFLGITEKDLAQDIPYVRILALNDRGRQILKQGNASIAPINIGTPVDHPYAALEARCDDLYGLFCTGIPEPPGANDAYRVHYQGGTL